MKSINKFMLTFVVLFMMFPALAFSMKISFFLGKATVTRNGKTAGVKSGDIIKEGDVIRTPKGGIVEVLYDDNSKITIQQNTVVRIGSKNVKGSSDVTVIAGEIKGKFGKLKKGVHRINTPTTVCSVRGTEFTVAVSNGGDSLVNLDEGRLDVDNAYDKVMLKEGQSIETETGNEPDVRNKKLDSDEWADDMNEDVADDPEERAEMYSEHFKQFGVNSDKSENDIKGLSDKTKKLTSKEDLEAAELEIIKTEEDVEHDMLMNEASKLSVENLMEDYEGSEHYKDFEEAVEKGNAVMEQQKKNQQAINKVKKEYKEAYDRIMKKYKSDKTRIFQNLDNYKKSMHNNKEGQ